jgi:hypothetical protein
MARARARWIWVVIVIVIVIVRMARSVRRVRFWMSCLMGRMDRLFLGIDTIGGGTLHRDIRVRD